MNNSNIRRFIDKKLWVILLLSLLCSIITAGVLFWASPVQYQSGTAVYISNKSFENGSQPSYTDMLASRILVENYAQIIKSGLFSEYVIKKTGISAIPADELSAMIEADVLNTSNILEMKIKYKDKALAKVIAEAFPQVLNENFSEILGSRQVTIVNKAYDAQPLLRGKILAIFLSFGLSIILLTGFFLLLGRGNSMIRTPEDVEKYLGITVTGTIPDFKL